MNCTTLGARLGWVSGLKKKFFFFLKSVFTGTTFSFLRTFHYDFSAYVLSTPLLWWECGRPRQALSEGLWPPAGQPARAQVGSWGGHSRFSEPQFRFPAENWMAFLLMFLKKSSLSHFNLQPSSDSVCPGPKNSDCGTNTFPTVVGSSP